MTSVLPPSIVLGTTSESLSVGSQPLELTLSTESFQSTTIDEAAQILQTYALLERLAHNSGQNSSVFGDGWYAGLELTRDGRASAKLQDARARRDWEDRLDQVRNGPVDAPSPTQATDRYGFFFNEPTQVLSPTFEHRTCLLEATAYTLKTGEPRASTSHLPQTAIIRNAKSPSGEELDTETSRITKWLEMLEPIHSSTKEGTTKFKFSSATLGSTSGKRKVSLKIESWLLFSYLTLSVTKSADKEDIQRYS